MELTWPPSEQNEIHLIDTCTYQFDTDPSYFIEACDEEIQFVPRTKFAFLEKKKQFW